MPIHAQREGKCNGCDYLTTQHCELCTELACDDDSEVITIDDDVVCACLKCLEKMKSIESIADVAEERGRAKKRKSEDEKEEKEDAAPQSAYDTPFIAVIERRAKVKPLGKRHAAAIAREAARIAKLKEDADESSASQQPQQKRLRSASKQIKA